MRRSAKSRIVRVALAHFRKTNSHEAAPGWPSGMEGNLTWIVPPYSTGPSPKPLEVQAKYRACIQSSAPLLLTTGRGFGRERATRETSVVLGVAVVRTEIGLFSSSPRAKMSASWVDSLACGTIVAHCGYAGCSTDFYAMFMRPAPPEIALDLRSRPLPLKETDDEAHIRSQRRTDRRDTEAATRKGRRSGDFFNSPVMTVLYNFIWNNPFRSRPRRRNACRLRFRIPSGSRPGPDSRCRLDLQRDTVLAYCLASTYHCQGQGRSRSPSQLYRMKTTS